MRFATCSTERCSWSAWGAQPTLLLFSAPSGRTGFARTKCTAKARSTAPESGALPNCIDLLRPKRFHRPFKALLEHPLRPSAVVVVPFARLRDALFGALNAVARNRHGSVLGSDAFAGE